MHNEARSAVVSLVHLVAIKFLGLEKKWRNSIRISILWFRENKIGRRYSVIALRCANGWTMHTGGTTNRFIGYFLSTVVECLWLSSACWKTETLGAVSTH